MKVSNTFYDLKFNDYVIRIAPLLYKHTKDGRIIGYSRESETRLQEAY